MVDLSIIIVNYNVKDYLENALLSISKAVKKLNVELYVVDNASEDGSSALIRQKFPEVNLIENAVNLGFSKANNKALRLCKGKYIVLLNPDTIVQEDTFEKLIKFLKDTKDAGMVGCKVLNPDGSLQLACRRSFPTPFAAFARLIGFSKLFPKSRIWGKYNLTFLDPDEITEVDAVSGSFMMIKKEVLDKAGYLDESYFLYGEDLDWCYRIKNAGFKIYYYPHTSIIHFKGESAKKSAYEPLKAFYKAMTIFAETHFRGRYFLYPLWLLKYGIWIKSIISRVGKNWRKVLTFTIDLFFINSAVLLAILIRFGRFVPLPTTFDIWSYFSIHAVCSFLWGMCLYFNKIYRKYETSRLLVSILAGFFLISTLTFFFKDYAFSRLVVLYAVFLITFLLFGWRIVYKLIRKIGAGKTISGKRTLIIGNNVDNEELFSKMKIEEYNVVGIINRTTVVKDNNLVNGVGIGTFENLDDFVNKYKVTDVIISTKNLEYGDISHIIFRCYEKGMNVRIIPTELSTLITKENKPGTFTDIYLVDVEYNLFFGYNLFFKRLLDIIGSSLILIILLPFYLFSIKFKSLHSKYRFILGLRKEPVYIKEYYKDGILYKGWEDYFPKIFLILKGELSLVGRDMKEEFSFAKGASLIKPGLINVTDFHSDYLYYLKNYTLLTDVKMIVAGVMRKYKG